MKLNHFSLYSGGECIANFTVPSDRPLTITSPNYPTNYLNNVYCRWLITAEPGKFVEIKFTSFSTELHYDFVDVGNGDDITDVGGRVVHASGNILPVDFTTSGNVAWVTFRSDRTKTNQGFGMEFVERVAPGK